MSCRSHRSPSRLNPENKKTREENQSDNRSRNFDLPSFHGDYLQWKMLLSYRTLALPLIACTGLCGLYCIRNLCGCLLKLGVSVSHRRCVLYDSRIAVSRSGVRMPLVETFLRLWFLFLAFFRFKPEKESSKAVLPVSSKGMVEKPEFVSPPHPRESIQQPGLTTTCGRPAGPHRVQKGNYVRHPSLYAKSNLHGLYLPLDRLPSNGRPHHHLPNWGFSTYSLILADRQFDPPPRPRSETSVSEDEFRTPVISDVHLPSVIVTPCTPSTKAGRAYISAGGLDELDSDEDEDEESSGSDASCLASVDSNPFLTDPSTPPRKEFELPPLGALNYHHRARSLTGTGRGLQLQRLSQSVRGQPVTFSSVPRVTNTGIVSNPVKRPDAPLLIENSTTPSASTTSLIPNFVCDSKRQQAISGQRIRSYMTTPSRKSEESPDQMLTQSVTVDTTSITPTSACHREDPKASAAADSQVTSSNLISSVHYHPQLGVVPYPEVFDFDAYFDSDSSSPSESTLKSSLSSSCSTIGSPDSQNPFLIPGSSPSTCASSAIFVSPPEPARRIFHISDTTASLTSLYTLSLSNVSTETDESASSNSRRFGFLHLGSSARKTKVSFDHEMKRYRDHYRPPAYSRSPAFVIDSPTTSRKFTGRGETNGVIKGVANKENERIALTTSTVSSMSTFARGQPKIANPISRQNPFLNHSTSTTRLLNTSRRMPALRLVGHQQASKPPTARKAQVNCTLDSSTTRPLMTAPAGNNNVATRHRLGPVAISQRRQMDIF